MRGNLFSKLSFLIIMLIIAGCQQKKPVSNVTTKNLSLTEKLRLACKKDPSNINKLIAYGNECFDTGKHDDAIEAYSKALALKPNQPKVLIDLGTTYRILGKPKSAIEYFTKAIEYSPKNILAHSNRAVVYKYDLREFDQALKDFKKVMALAPKKHLLYDYSKNEIVALESELASAKD